MCRLPSDPERGRSRRRYRASTAKCGYVVPRYGTVAYRFYVNAALCTDAMLFPFRRPLSEKQPAQRSIAELSHQFIPVRW